MPDTIPHTLPPAFSEASIPVVFAANDAYVPVFAAALQSLLEHASPQYNYDILLLESGIRRENKCHLSRMVGNRSNVSLRFHNCTAMVQGYPLHTNDYLSSETHYRFLIQDVLPDYDKVVYLDCDVVLKADIAELYHTDVEGCLLAAARDPDFLGQIHGAKKATMKYVERTFHMQNPDNYFQAGVLVLNEKELRKHFTVDQWLTWATEPYMYNDQDILNLRCEGRVKYLDMSWNLLTDCDHTRISQVVVHAPASIREAYQAAALHPRIIHYAGHKKPWHNPTEDRAQHFWSALKHTPYYEEAFYQMMENVAQARIQEARRERSPLRKLWRFAKQTASRLPHPKNVKR